MYKLAALSDEETFATRSKVYTALRSFHARDLAHLRAALTPTVADGATIHS